MNMPRSICISTAIFLTAGMSGAEMTRTAFAAESSAKRPVLAAQTKEKSGEAPKDRAQMNLSKTLPQEYVLTLSELRDAGLALQQIRGEAIHIYLEAARKPVPLNDDPKLVEPKTIPTADLPIDASCEPARRDWLVFFVGSIEPIMHLLNDDVEQVESEETKLVMPNVEKALSDKLWHEWIEGIKDLNKEVDGIFALLENDKVDNTKLANQAVAIFNSCQKLEDVRLRVHKVIQESEPK